MQEDKNNRALTVLIITISIIAIGYFGYQAVSDNAERKSDNPYEYSVENYKNVDSTLKLYTETGNISIDYQEYYGLTLDENDDLYIAVDDKIIVFNKEKQISRTINLDEPAYCLEADKNGKVYAGMADHIQVFSIDGKLISKWPSVGEKGIITSVGVTDQFVFAADAGNLVVWKYDKSGNLISEIGRKDEEKDIPGFVIPSPYFDVDIDPDGFLWVVNPGRHTLENYTPDGSIRTSWGISSMKTEGFAGCCNPSHIVILSNGYFVTSEKGIPRIKIYDFHGRFISLVADSKDFNEGTVDLDLAIDSQEKIYVLDESKKAVRIFTKNKD